MEETFIKLITENGLGVASFALLAYMAVKVINGAGIVVGKTEMFLDKLLNNHLAHIQDSLESMEEKMDAIAHAIQASGKFND